MESSGFFDKAENRKDQQSRSFIAPRQQRTLRLPKALQKREREGCRYSLLTHKLH
jgi:hypothetical protein